MIPAENLFAFVLAAIGLMLIPGPSVLFVVGRSLSLGRIGGLLSVLGNGLGALTSALAVAFGIGFLVQESVVLFTVIKVAGGLYLIYLGIQTIRHRNDHLETAEGEAPKRKAVWRLMLEGYLVGVTNPKTLVFFVAVLPQFVDRSAGSVQLQMAALALICFGIGLLVDTLWALLASAARTWFGRKPQRLGRLSATGGVMMIGLGATVLVVGQGKE